LKREVRHTCASCIEAKEMSTFTASIRHVYCSADAHNVCWPPDSGAGRSAFYFFTTELSKSCRLCVEVSLVPLVLERRCSPFLRWVFTIFRLMTEKTSTWQFSTLQHFPNKHEVSGGGVISERVGASKNASGWRQYDYRSKLRWCRLKHVVWVSAGTFKYTTASFFQFVSGP
jgi:hypothetical protein